MKTKVQTLHSDDFCECLFICCLEEESIMTYLNSSVRSMRDFGCAVYGINEEPDAVILHVRICVGALRQWGVLPRLCNLAMKSLWKL